MRMKTLTRYILTEYFPPLLLGVIIFTFVLLLDNIFDFVDLFLNKGVRFVTILKLLSLILPSIFSLTIPMGFLLGSLLTFGRLSEDGEITALRASGQHMVRLFWPPLFVALIISTGLVYFNAEITPRAQNSFRQLYREVLKQNPLVQLEEKTFLKITNFRIYVHSINKKTGLLKGIHIYRLEEKAPPTRIHAREGYAQTHENRIVFQLFDGTIQQIDQEEPARTTVSSFKKYDIQIPFKNSSQTTRKNIRSMKTSEIIREIASYRSQNLPTTYLETEYHLRNAISFAPFAFCLIGMMLGIKLERGGKSIGFGMSLFIIFIYYLLLVGGITISEKGYLASWFDLWLCNIVMLFIGGILLINILKK